MSTTIRPRAGSGSAVGSDDSSGETVARSNNTLPRATESLRKNTSVDPPSLMNPQKPPQAPQKRPPPRGQARQQDTRSSDSSGSSSFIHSKRLNAKSKIQKGRAQVKKATTKAFGLWEALKTFVFRPMSCVVVIVGRVLLFVINTILLAIGIAFLAVGAMMLSHTGVVEENIKRAEAFYERAVQQFHINEIVGDLDFGHMVDSIATVFVLFGTIVGLVSVLGCVGGCLANRCMLRKYIQICILLLSIETGFVYYLYTTQTIGKKTMYASLKNYGGIVSKDTLSIGWNVLMKYYNCCGVNDFHDFQHLKKWPPKAIDHPGFHLLTPVVCCKGEITKNITCHYQGHANTTVNNMNTGCHQVLFDFVFKNTYTITALVLVFLFQVVVSFFSSWILWDMKRDNTKNKPITTDSRILRQRWENRRRQKSATMV